MVLKPHFGRTNQVALMVLLHSSRSQLGSHIFGEATRSEVKRAGVWGFKEVCGVMKSVYELQQSQRENISISIPLGSVDFQ